MEDSLFLVFVSFMGKNSDGTYKYRFDYAISPDSVWGDGFNIVPSSIVPKIEPDINSLTGYQFVDFPFALKLAQSNDCFSMQDCIDGIIALCYIDPNSFTDYDFVLHFGDSYDYVQKLFDTLKKAEALTISSYQLYEDRSEIMENLNSVLSEAIENTDNDQI